MEGFQIVVQAKPRFRSPAELQEAALNRVSPEDIERLVVKLKSDVNVAVDRIDKALASRRDTRHHVRTEHRSSAQIEHSAHTGRILSIQ